MYAITATAQTRRMGTGDTAWSGAVQVPTFYLDESVQGITSENHAARIARDIIDPLGLVPDDRLSITAVKVG